MKTEAAACYRFAKSAEEQPIAEKLSITISINPSKIASIDFLHDGPETKVVARGFDGNNHVLAVIDTGEEIIFRYQK